MAAPRESRGWNRRALALAGLACFLLVAADARLKEARSAGFRLDGWTWEAQVANAPDFWERLAALPAADSFEASAPDALRAIEVAIRKTTGIRPTPSRMRLWAGYQAAIGGEGEDWCLILRPGLLLRLTSVVRSPVQPLEDGAPFARELAAGWRDGFLLIASSPAYLERMRREGQPLSDEAGSEQAVALAWPANGAALRLDAAPDLPFALELPVQPPSGPPMRAPDGWDDAAGWVACRGGFAPEATAAVAALLGRLPEADAIRAYAEAWWRAYTPVELVPPRENAWAAGLFEAGWSGESLTAEVVWSEFGPGVETAEPWAEALRAPHQWDETPGWLVPVEGAARTWGMVSEPEALHRTSHEHLMPRQLAATFQPDSQAVLAARLDWLRASESARAILREAADAEWIPGWNRRDVEREIIPLLDAFGGWGRFELRLEERDGVIAGAGYLARDAGGA